MNIFYKLFYFTNIFHFLDHHKIQRKRKKNSIYYANIIEND